MSNILITNKSNWAFKILNGEMGYEFRRYKMKIVPGDKAFVYASSPTKAIIGEWVAGKILYDSFEKIWKHIKNNAGVNRLEIFDYTMYGRWSNDTQVKLFAIQIMNPILYTKPKALSEIYNGKRAPQSFCYLH